MSQGETGRSNGDDAGAERSGKRPGLRPKLRPKGRALDRDALVRVRGLLAEMPRRRDLLIEALHRLQDGTGHLAAPDLRALAEEFSIPQAEVFEVASFYHHFDIVKEGETPPPALTIRVCDSVACMIAGAEALATALDASVDPQTIRIQRVPCIGRCAEAPAVHVGTRAIAPATTDSVHAAIAADDIREPIPDHACGLAAYRAAGGYALLEACLAGKKTPEEVIAMLSDAGLRGLGGAGFPAGRKWEFVRAAPAPRMVTVNADEGEPGTFKDRHHLERDPHRMIEGALIAAWAVGAARTVIYLRDEYAGVRALLEREIAFLREAGLDSHAPIDLRRGAGAYICGEESAMLESIEGKRGLPRHRPPYIATKGLFGRPTLNHNVETLFWLRDIIEEGPAWFASQGRRGAKGFRSFSVSGRVRDPGVKQAPAGITVNELIGEYCGGMQPGHALAAWLPGGASGGILPASLADEPLDFGLLDRHGAFVGSHAIVIFSDHDDLRSVALNLMRFFRHESCGQCTPCRAGTQKIVQLLEDGRWEAPLLDDLALVMRDASICGLGQAAANPVTSMLRHFPECAPQSTN
ncbi:MAG: cytoplasmic NAD-dependent formate dehydrogenase flavin subunit FdwB [Saliniramus fredricksonii]|uniref:Cytoplasmic NAD-dependent formate dehydrogenase flavin subunit FdwB n=1 Tax=Saliniramus fredricksonii TaxID=1653334 RepID=A0A0P8A094_9HYPH|nr:NAD(P)H-dependent oxidoreductase subunit E [Saliniramus fredricksonii]KPQ10774.1 MAG: cytoplasmic NAD-dependent formate dehydrogenase flavin subunit FdwB [Saliniramus fredricksonii]SCC79521.1 NAD-dependent formate dehydrogenase flavoprotein subunit [Saliniramus fredricksonii]